MHTMRALQQMFFAVRPRHNEAPRGLPPCRGLAGAILQPAPRSCAVRGAAPRGRRWVSD